MRYLVLSCSLNPNSRSRILARMVREHLAARPGGAELVDLQDYDLPLSDGGACYGHPQVIALTPKVREAKGIVVATAIYNYDVNAAAKNFLELTGKAWEGKVAGFICAAGRPRQLHVRHAVCEQPHAGLPLPHRAALRLCGAVGDR